MRDIAYPELRFCMNFGKTFVVGVVGRWFRGRKMEIGREKYCIEFGKYSFLFRCHVLVLIWPTNFSKLV